VVSLFLLVEKWQKVEKGYKLSTEYIGNSLLILDGHWIDSLHCKYREKLSCPAHIHTYVSLRYLRMKIAIVTITHTRTNALDPLICPIHPQK
jgi:hypothetical protein